MLEPAEIDAEFGEYGSASEGTLFRDFRSCDWEMGDKSLQLRVLPYVSNPRERLLSEREEQEQNPEYEFIDLTGVGEYAYAIRWEDTTQLIFLSDGAVFYFFAYVPAVDELTALARHVVDRI